jgi:multiple sugar transport system ATP-binding protein
MDEPLSNLDAKLRVSMRAQLSSLHSRLGATTIYVTHDQVEAMTLGQRVAVLRDGRLQQVDTPQRLYREPVNLFVAAFIGSPAMNLVEAMVADRSVEFGGHRFPLAGDPPLQGRVVLGVRPEAFEDAALADAALPTLNVDVAVVEDLGADTHVIFTLNAPMVDTEEIRQAAETDAEEDALLAGDGGAVFNARVGTASAARPGAPLRLAVDPRGFHFFDPGSGERIGGPSVDVVAQPAPVGA